MGHPSLISNPLYVNYEIYRCFKNQEQYQYPLSLPQVRKCIDIDYLFEGMEPEIRIEHDEFRATSYTFVYEGLTSRSYYIRI